MQAEKYITKLHEAGLKILSHVVDNNVLVLNLKSSLSLDKVVLRIKNLLMLEDQHINAVLQNEEIVVSILIDNSLPIIITDGDRLQNKLTGQHKNSPDVLHIQRFIRTVKEIYNITLTVEDYNKINDELSKYHFRKIYDINGQVALSSFIYLNDENENVTVYCIYGNRSDRNRAGLKSAWPSIFNEETLLAVPDKLAIEGVNRHDFTQMVKQTLIDKRKYFETLKEIHKDSTDREIFENEELSKKEKSILKRYLRNDYTLTLEDAIYFTIEKF